MSVVRRLPALAGVVDFRNPESLDERCRALLPDDDAEFFAASQVSMGALCGDAPWQAARASPDVSETRRFAIVGDIRLDNRDDLARDLGVAPDCPDRAIILEAWQRWGWDALDSFRGDYAFALWAKDREELALVRGPFAATQLFYRHDAGWLAFASLAQPLADMPGLGKSLNFESAARFVAGIPHPGPDTFFAGVCRLEHAQATKFDRQGFRLKRFWRPDRIPAEGRSDADIAEEFRDLFDRAVAARTERGEGIVAAHLSAGRDSGAVAATAARILGDSGQPVLALTSAPRPGFCGSGIAGRLDDESAIAAATGALHPNLNHVVVRPDGDPFAGLRDVHALTPNPVPHLSNHPWGHQILKKAAAEGASVLLGGAAGNFSISGGGDFHLRSILREQGPWRWMGQANGMLGGPLDVARVLNWTFGARMPLEAHRLLRRLVGSPQPAFESLNLLREPFRAHAAAVVQRDIADLRPPLDPFAFRADMLAGQDPANAAARALFGIDGRDPTGDRDLIDFCFTVPAHLLVGSHGARPLYEMAFGDRLDPRQLRPRLRGYQGADWDFSFTPEAVTARLNEVGDHRFVRELIDLETVRGLLASWPSRWTLTQMLHYRNDLLGAIAAADFIAVNF